MHLKLKGVALMKLDKKELHFIQCPKHYKQLVQNKRDPLNFYVPELKFFYKGSAMYTMKSKMQNSSLIIR